MTITSQSVDIQCSHKYYLEDKLMKIKPQKMYTMSYHLQDMMLKKNYLKVVICFTFAITALVVMILPHILTNSRIHHRRHVRYATDLKYILFWGMPKTQRSRLAHHKPTEFLPGQKMFINQKCPHINCYITYDKSTLANDEDFDAVVFDIDNVRKMDVNFLNLTRSPEQLYIFRSSEPPEKHSLCDYELEDFFNMTWTYRLDSDIPQPFLKIYNSNKTLVGPKTNMNWLQRMRKSKRFGNKIKQKKKAVAWILTKCKLKSKHEDFIKELRNELKGYNHTVDIYGPCSQKKCPGGSAKQCYKMVEKEYFFQIVLEEYFSKDYVTEVMVTAMSRIAIPIVLGPAEHYSNFLPPGSYIQAQAFDMNKLGALLNYLIKNTDMYEFFFDWMKYYYYQLHSRSQVCDLCATLNQYNGTTVVKSDFRQWWDPEYRDVCQRKRLYKMFNADP